MQEYDNELRGVLFKNDRKENDRQPDYKGSCQVGNVEYWMSAWIKDGRNGKFMSFAFTPKQEDMTNGAPERQGGGSNALLEDDVPFAAW